MMDNKMMYVLLGIILISVMITGCDQLTTTPPGWECTMDDVNVVLVIDQSGSMQGEAMNSVKTAAKMFARQLLENPSNKVGVVTFATVTHAPTQYLTNDIDDIEDYIDDIDPSLYGKTCAACGISAAAGLMYGFNDHNAMVFLTDGDANRCTYGACNNIPARDEAKEKALKAYDEKHIKIYTIAYESACDDSAVLGMLNYIADIAHGNVYSAGMMDIGAAYADIVNRECLMTCDTTLSGYCDKGIKECRNNEVWVCEDTDSDGCGDMITKAETCTGNYNCQDGVCQCKAEIKCSNGKSNGDTWCDNNYLRKCVVDQATCSDNIMIAKTCNPPLTCDNGMLDCVCGETCNGGDRRMPSSTNDDYDECVDMQPCNTWLGKDCPNGRVYNDYTKTCECDTATLDMCNVDNLHNKIVCKANDLNKRERCTMVTGSGFANDYCWEWVDYDTNPNPATRTCTGGEYLCKVAPCTTADCSPDGTHIRNCESTTDSMCPVLGDFRACLPDYKCSSTTHQCEPQHQCEPLNSQNGMYMRCNPLNDREIQECQKDSDGVYRWHTINALTCGMGSICTHGSDAFCTLAYGVDIDVGQDFAVGLEVTDVMVTIASNELDIGNVVVVVCVESDALGCTDEAKYTSIAQIRTNPNGQTTKLNFAGPEQPGNWFVSAYVNGYRESTLTSVPIYVLKRLNLDVNIPTTNFINEPVMVSYRAEDADTGNIIVPDVDIYLDMNGVNIPYTHTAVNQFEFVVNNLGTVHYMIIGSHAGYLDNMEEGYIEVGHQVVDYTMKLDGVNIKDLFESRVDTGTVDIELRVWQGTENLNIDTGNLRLRNPAQAIGEGTVLTFHRSSDNIYTARAEFAESGKSYYLTGTFTILATGEIVGIEKTINTKGGTGGGEDPLLDPMMIGAVVFGLVILLAFAVWLIRRRRR